MKFIDYFPECVFQTFKDNPEAGGYAKVFLEYDEPEFRKLNKQGCGIYFTPNGFKEGRKLDKLTRLNAIYADLDVGKEGSAEDVVNKKIKLGRALLTDKIVPNFIIETKNGLQPLWLLEEGEKDVELYTNVILGIIEWSKQYGALGDQVKDVTRVLRLPGYNHVKGEPYMCKARKYSDSTWPLAVLQEAFPYEIKQEETKVVFKKNDVSLAVDNIDFQDLIIRAFSSVGRSASFDKQKRLILDGRLTGTHQGKTGDGDFLASSSHEPFCGNRITATADILGVSNKEARAWIVEEFNISPAKARMQKELAKPIEKKEMTKFYSWGTDKLTWNFAPIKRTTYTVLVGETGDGKTTYCYDMAIKNANLGHKVLYISLEMDTREIFENIARAYSGIKIKEEVTNTIPERKQQAFDRKMNELQNIKNLTTKGVRRGSEVTWSYLEEIMNGDWDLVFIDNLDLIVAEDGESDYERQRRISKNAMSYTSSRQIPLIMLHHYRKRSKGGSVQRTLDDIGGSAKITHDADRIVILGRNKGEDLIDQDKAELKLWLRKARGYSEDFKTVYFHRGSFYDTYQEDKPEYTPEWWSK